MAEAFAKGGEATVLELLQQTEQGLTAGEIRKSLEARGLSKDQWTRTWPRIRGRVKSHAQVEVVDKRYRWHTADTGTSAADALELLGTSKLLASRRAELIDIIRAALGGPPQDLEEEARKRQAEIDAKRALADLAGEVEELSANEADAGVMVRTVRALAKRHSLEPIERAGEEITFDPKRHKPIGPSIRVGAPVVVVRPGHVWKAPTEDVLLGKAIVEE